MERIRAAWNWLMSRFYCLRGDTQRHWGNSYVDVQRYWAAIEDYTRAIVLDPAYVQPYYNRGVLYWREIGNPYRAIEDLTQVIAMDPGRAEAFFNRAMAYKLHRQPERATADLQEYLARGQDGFWLEAARRQLAELHEEPGRQG